jgi:hypothetical protein
MDILSLRDSSAGWKLVTHETYKPKRLSSYELYSLIDQGIFFSILKNPDIQVNIQFRPMEISLIVSFELENLR